MAMFKSAKIVRQLLPMSIMGVLSSLALFGIVYLVERGSSESRFGELADQRIIAIRANIAIARGSVNLLAAHFAVAPPGATSREDFRRLVEQTLRDHDFIQGYSWDPRVPHDQRARYEEAARRDGLDGFVFTERDAEGALRPAARRPEYIPIYYMEPVASNRPALGFDLASQPIRRLALERGRDKGVPEATGRITLVQEHGGQYGVLILAPVFGREGPADAESNRRSLTGYISGVFRLGDLISSSSSSAAVTLALPMVDIHLFDMSAAEGERRLFPKQDTRAPEELTAGLHASESFVMAGRSWLLIATPSEAFVAASRTTASYALLVTALLFTAVYLSLMKSRIDQAEKATALAREMGRAKLRLGEAQRIAKLVSVELDLERGTFATGADAMEMLGLPKEQTSGPVDFLLQGAHPDDREKVRDALIHAAGQAVDLEFRVEVGGEERVLHVLADDLAEEGRSIITLQDITARKAAEEERAAMIERIAESDRFEALGTLAGGIAHEINTPTQYVGDNIVFMKESQAELLELAQAVRASATQGGDWKSIADRSSALDLDFLAAELPAAADQALDGTGQIAKIVQAIKEFSYPSSKSAHPVDLNHMIDVVATVTRNQWKYVAQMECDLDPDLPKVFAVEGEINQVLVNLIVNAAHAIAQAGGDAPGRITVRTRRLDDEVELSVADTGIGIPAANLKQIFEMFFTTKAPGQGTGQGLAISRAIIHRHGGQISAESQPGLGACFRIRLPLTATQGA
ncbi:Signal transduction histidine kinase [Magnetospirillum sp. XM-1]|uniref:CHASE domain-containing protein n=1 Tax=Magnetospirillum sp. XM-1 TaxID=1663591 RepID=UPI00073DCFBD|nr:CHASE domain-containing protein [Magnetospirillum sp. XM-1]CUW41076.1 Signal transduction histidine kinase [Magnetospirillum sp. XM-1]